MSTETILIPRTVFAPGAVLAQPLATLTIRPTPAADPHGYPRLVSPRYRSMDAWRGLACLMLMLVHASFSYKAFDTAAERAAHPWAHAMLASIEKLSIGVPMFFVISGYCVSATCDSSRRRSHRSADYFKRRVRRIIPPYWAALLLTLAAYTLVLQVFPLAGLPMGGWRDGSIPSWRSFSSLQWLGTWTLTEQWRGGLFGHGPVMLLPPAWTLCYEEQFYAVCGLMLLVRSTRFFNLAVLVSFVTAGFYGTSILIPRFHVDGLFLDGRWLMFATGILLYYALNYQRHAAQWTSAAVLLGGALVATAIYKGLAPKPSDEAVREIAYSLRVSALFALGLMLLRPFDNAIANARIFAPLFVSGQMCYSLYLIHWPTMRLLQIFFYHVGVRGFIRTLCVTLPVAMAGSFLMAWLFYLGVERHFLNPRRTVNRV